MSPSIPGPEAAILTQDSITFRDLNKNGRLDPYEDLRRPIEERVDDLLSQMNLAEKAGLMFHTIIRVGMDGELVETTDAYNPHPTSHFITTLLMNHFNVHQMPAPRLAVSWHNHLQKLAERTRLGIPVTISSDPRHAFSRNPGASHVTDAFSRWPEPIGLAAANDPGLVEQFGDIARQEYCAVGIRAALHPMADLSTEPRWSRINGTFGEDAALSARMVSAYIKGFQGKEIGPHSVSCMTKHFPGGGPQKDGFDPHFSYGKEQVYPGNNFDYHLGPFEAAFQAGTGQIMPYYGQPIGLPIEEVGFGYNKEVITGLLRNKYGFDGVVCTDWGLVSPHIVDGKVFMEARCWGVEHLSPEERAQKVIEAGADQFGGEACPELILALVQCGNVSEERINLSARRLLRDKFRLGLFDNPYINADVAEKVVGNADFRTTGELAQRKSIVMLKKDRLPLRGRPRVYVEGISAQAAAAYSEVVERVEDAEVAILRLNAPFEQKPPEMGFAAWFHEGDLDFKGAEKARILALLERIPTIVAIDLDRPAVIPEIAQKAAGLLATFGANDGAILDVVFGRFAPTGKLPFELPSSMESVRRQKTDVPYDSGDPVFPFGFGLTY